MKTKLNKRKCKGCGVDISIKHLNAKFCSKNCKDKYWNWENPRGKFAHLNDGTHKSNSDSLWDAHWDAHKELLGKE